MEWLRIFRKKGLMGVLACLLAAQLFLFLYLAYREETQEEVVVTYSINGVEYEMDAEETEETLDFKERIAAVMEQADSLGSVSIFAQADSFSSKNLQKTKKDYSRILDVEPVAFADQFLTEFFENRTAGAIAVLCAVLVAFFLTEEKKQGLRCMVFAAPGGRGKLALSRFGALFLWDVVIVFLCYGTTLLVSCVRWEGFSFACLGYPVQSLELFEMLPYTWTIGGLLLIYFFYLCAILYVVSLFAWCLFYCVERLALSVGVLGIAAGASYLFKAQISASHPLAALHFCSPWYLLCDASFFSEYYNLNIRGNAVNKDAVVLCVYIAAALLLSAVTLTVAVKRYPCRASGGFFAKPAKRLRAKLDGIYDGMLLRLPMMGAEFFKAFFFQKGIFVLAFFAVALIYSADFGAVLRTEEQDLYYAFMEQYTGVPDEASAAYLSELEETLAQVEAEYLEAVSQYEAGKLSSQEYLESTMRYEAFQSDRDFLADITEQTEYLDWLKTEKGIDGWYINTYSYSNLLKEESSLSYLLLVLCVVLLCSGIFAWEKHSGMQAVLRSAKKGRAKLFYQKRNTSLWIALLFYLLFEGISVASVIHAYGIDALGAPAQSLETLQFVPFSCPVGAFLLIVYLLRSAMLLAAASMVCMFSALAGQRAAIAMSGLLCVPSVLSLVGISRMAYFSLDSVLAVTPFMLRAQSMGAALLVCAFVIILSAACTVLGHLKWCGFRGREKCEKSH